MKEINIATTLVTKRKEKGVTQEQIAEYIGVSKASVSKWETGQSYPDITFLPELAAYFNISIDMLIGYSPQMTKDDIKELYHKLASQFASEPFDDVLEECFKIIKKYYSCFPLLYQMAVLLVNHHMMAKDQQQKEEILHKTVALCSRVRTESDDVWLSKEAISIEVVCYFSLQQPQAVLDLLGETIRPMIQDAEMVAQAYQLMGNIPKAKEATQVNMYQHLLSLVGTAPTYLLLNIDDSEKVDEILYRTLALAELYHLDKLHPNVMAQIYYAAAQAYCTNGNTSAALEMLGKYTDTCTVGFFPITLHGDAYFDSIDPWLSDLSLGGDPPRNEKVVRESMLQGVLDNPAFACLAEQPQYKDILEKLKRNLGGESS